MPKLKPVQTVFPVPERFSAEGSLHLPVKWWDSFGDAQLSKLIAKALQGNLELRVAWARLAQSRALAKGSRSPFYPSLDLQGNADVGVNPNGFLSRPSASLVASYEFDVWGRLRSTADAARLDVLASEELLKAAAISLSAEVATAWVHWVEKYGQLELLKEQMKTSQQVLALLEVRFRSGQSSATDVLQQRQLLESQRGELVQVDAQARVLLHQIAVLLGLPPKAMQLAQTSTFPKMAALPQTGLPMGLIRRRPDVRNAYLRVHSAHRRVAAAIADQFPRLTLSASVTVQAGQVFLGNWLASLAAGLFAPLFDGFRRRAEVERTRAVVKEVFHQYSQTVLKALQEVEDALAREQGQWKLLTSQAKQMSLASLALQQTRYNYVHGVENFLRVLDTQRQYQTLQRSYLSAQRDLRLFRIALCRALAGGWTLSPPANTMGRN